MFLAVGVAAAAFALVTSSLGVLSSQEEGTVDVRFSIRGPLGAPKDVAVVGIDDVTFGSLRRRWPFPRRLHAQVIDRLAQDGAKVIAMDVQFTEPTNPTDDLALFDAARRARNVVFSTTEVNAKGGTDVLGGDVNLRQAHSVAGNGLIPSDAGGITRRFLYEIDGLKTLPVVAAERATGRPVSPSPFGSSGAWIDYAGVPGTVQEMPYSRVLKGQFPKGFFRDKVVVVGATSPTQQDLHATSVSGSTLMAGPEIQADAIWTVLHGFPLRSVPGWVDALVSILLALVAPLASLRLSPLRSLLVAVAAGGLFAVGVQFAFDHGRVLAFVYPLVGLSVSAIGCVALGAVLEAFERERIRDLFGRFVPDAVVDEVLKQTRDGLHLGGSNRVCTMMFTDLRSFTTFSESRDAEDVITVLNYYFGEMSEAVLNHGGTLCSYLGDGMMIVFGAPVDQADHADRAVAAAAEILVERLPRVNAWLREQGYGDGFRMGIGLNSGPLMVGNVGSDRRMEYTTIGDTVNTASRLEGLTKGSPYPLFISETTRELLVQKPEDLTYVSEFDVRGRSETVKVWSLARLVAEPAADAAPEALPAIVPT
jgi:adenylate cyclase